MVVVIYEDNHMLVVEKPTGILTQPSGTAQTSLEGLAKQWLKEKYQKPGAVFLEALHRVDRPVSGIVLFAKTSKGLSRLQHSMRTRQSHKEYRAVVEGEWEGSEGVLEDYLFHDDFFARVVDKDVEGAKWASLAYEVLMRGGGRTLLKIILHTGRYHQIRVQLASRGFPIVGDVRYGSRTAYRLEAIMLHHCRLEVPHPIGNKIMIFESPQPVDWDVILFR